MRFIVLTLGVVGGVAVWWLLRSQAGIDSSNIEQLAGAEAATVATTEDPETLAEQAFYQGDYERATALYRTIVHEQPGNGQAWARLAYATHEMGQYEVALDLHERAAGFEENRTSSQFKIGCALARLGRIEEALEALEEAVRFGYRDRSWCEQEADLAVLRDSERFSRVLNRMGPPPEGKGELDFWTGYWIARDPSSGRPRGHVSVQRVEGGHVYQEQWSEYSGHSGRGMLYFDPTDGLWCLDRVDNQGRIQRLRGEREGDALVLNGELIYRSGQVQPLRVVLEPTSGSGLMLASHVSEDGGENWVPFSETLLNRDNPMWVGRGR
ncbi:tetratricopeptide repeat protein [Tautonia rosea]|uniref:tetratricopeptide repeat protein n=1 Tax=Tautonia rosea TaxID=2728037 RepID=UPI001475F32F|nr:tetratricopeptide repeat protein [Tautonia rosea]